MLKAMTITAMDETGTGLARIAQLSAVDSDGDTYVPGAFAWTEKGEQWCSILPAHDRKATPLGKARVYEDGDWAMAELKFNLDVPEAKAWHSALVFDLANGPSVQEYSYGFAVLDSADNQIGGERVRVLKRLRVDEVSPVLKGAGVGTGTVSIKSAELKAEKFGSLIAGLGELASAIGEDRAAVSATGLKQLGEIHAAIGKALQVGDRTGSKDIARIAVDTAMVNQSLRARRLTALR